MSGWLPVLAARAAQAQVRTKSCILLWMDGGPSHKDTFDLRPGTEQGGPFRAIQTSVPASRSANTSRKLAPPDEPRRHHPQHEHRRRRSRPGQVLPAHRLQGRRGRPGLSQHRRHRLQGTRPPTPPLPNFVSIGNRSYGAGFLGARHAPLIVNDPLRGVENLRPAVESDQFQSRMGLLDELESGFNRTHQAEVAAAHRTTYQGAVTLMHDAAARRSTSPANRPPPATLTAAPSSAKAA